MARVHSRYRLVNVRHYRRSIGRTCMHCNRSATIRATVRERTALGLFARDVHYCDTCIDEARRVYR